MRAGKGFDGVGLTPGGPVVGEGLPAPGAARAGRPPSKAKGLNGGFVDPVVGVVPPGLAEGVVGFPVLVLGEPGRGNEGGFEKGCIPAFCIMDDMRSICRRASGLELRWIRQNNKTGITGLRHLPEILTLENLSSLGTESTNSWVHSDDLFKDGGIGKHGGHGLEELGGIEHILHLGRNGVVSLCR